MLITYTIHAQSKRFTMLAECEPDEAKAAALDKWPDATCEAIPSYTEQLAGLVMQLTTLEARRSALERVSERYREEVKKLILERWNK